MANIEKTIPFTWERWDPQDVLHNTYYEVEFIEDFGTFCKGDKFISIDVDYGKGIIEAYNDEEDVNGDLQIIKRQEFKANAI